VLLFCPALGTGRNSSSSGSSRSGGQSQFITQQTCLPDCHPWLRVLVPAPAPAIVPKIMSKHLPSEQYTIIELDTRPDCDQLQDALERLTVGRLYSSAATLA
jgi:hypothetical protein